MRLVMSGVLVLFFSQALLGQAQQAGNRPWFIIKNGTTSLLDPIIPTFNVGLEVYLAEDVALYVEGGPALKYRYFYNEPTMNKLNGYRLRAALRYYFEPPVIGDPSFYIELYGSYNRIDANIQGDFVRRSSIGSFQQRLNYDIDRIRSGVYANIGVQAIDLNRFVIETGAGLGMIRREETFGNIPSDASFITNGSNVLRYSSRDIEESWTGMVFFYVNLGYAVRKKRN
jgi:hypothetical protein